MGSTHTGAPLSFVAPVPMAPKLKVIVGINSMKLKPWVCALLCLIFAAGCRATPSQTPDATQAQAYPSPTGQGPVQAYPAPPTPDPGAVRLVLDLPLKVGATVVTGQGPAGLVVGIINVTL